MSIPARSTHRHDDAGFTLPELVIVIVLVGLIMASISSALVVSMRSQTSAAASLAESHDQQQLAVYLPTDIANAVLSTADIQPTAGAGCSGVPAGKNVLRMTSVDASSGNVVSYTVAYRIEGAASPYQLVRYVCTGVGAAKRVPVVNFLPTNSSATASSTSSSVSMTVLTQQSTTGLPFTITGTPRTLNLGGGANGGTSCVFSTGSLTPASVGLNGTALATDVTVNVATTGTCDTLNLLFDTGLGPQALALTGAGSTWSATIPAAAYQWTDGIKSVVVGGTSNTGTMILAVGSVCAFASGTAVPGQAALSGTNLATDVVVSINVLGSCGPLSLTFNTGSGIDKTVALIGAGSTRSAVIAGVTSGYSWTVGAHPFAVTGTSNGGSIAFSTLGPCVFVSGSGTPTPLSLSTGGTLASSATFTVNTSGACTAVSVDVQTGNNNGSRQSIVLIQNSPNVWTRTVTPDAFNSWTTGTKPVDVVGTITAGAAFTVDVQQACVATGGSVAPIPINVGAGGLLTSGPLTVSVTTSGPCTPTTITATVATGNDPSSNLALVLTGGPTTWSATIPAAVNTWTAGTKSVSISGPANEPTTFNFTVAAPCVFVSGTMTAAGADTATVNLTHGSPSQLTASANYGIKVITTGACTSVSAAIPTTPTATVLLAQTGANTWAAAVPTTVVWAAGPARTVTVAGTSAGAAFTVGVNTLPCTYVPAGSGANTTKRTGPGGSGPVNADVVITVITTGACTGVTATVGPSGAPAGPFALVQGPIGTWKHTLPRAAFPGGWTAGTKTVTITGPSPAPPAPTFQFVVT